MSVGPFPAINIQQVLLGLTPLTCNFWQQTELDAQAYGIKDDLFYRPITFDAEAASVIFDIEQQLR